MWQHRERLELIRSGWKRSRRSVIRRTKGSRRKMCTVTKSEEILLFSDDPNVVRAREFGNAKRVCLPYTGRLTDISEMRVFGGDLFLLFNVKDRVISICRKEQKLPRGQRQEETLVDFSWNIYVEDCSWDTFSTCGMRECRRLSLDIEGLSPRSYTHVLRWRPIRARRALCYIQIFVRTQIAQNAGVPIAIFFCGMIFSFSSRRSSRFQRSRVTRQKSTKCDEFSG